jgi:hypothetical protein
LTPQQSRQLSRNLGKITAYIAEPERAGRTNRLVQAVDLPDFVAQLLHGVFDAIVDASIKQMEAYANLVKDLARTVNQFAGPTVTAARARDRLVAKYPGLLDCDRGDDQSRGAGPQRKRFPKASRQQLLATMALMGINRIVVTSGRIPAKRRRR